MGAVLSSQNKYDLEEDDKCNSTSMADNVDNKDAMFELIAGYRLGVSSTAFVTSFLDGWIGVMIAVKTSENTAQQCWTFQEGLGVSFSVAIH